MVRYQIAGRGVSDKNVLSAMEAIPRHLFVPELIADAAYDDTPLPIGYGQTISQPYIVAIMTELLELRDSDVVLELGTGSGYQAAVICSIAKFVRSYERVPELAEFAKENLGRIGIENIEVICSDGTDPEPYDEEGYDAAIITAASPEMPEFLYPLMNEGGRIVAPVGSYFSQNLVRIKITNERPSITNHGGCRFVPLKGLHGWKEEGVI